MSAKTPATTYDINLNGTSVKVLQRLAGAKSQTPGAPFVVLEPGELDAPGLLKLFTALGAKACQSLAVKALNRVIGPATGDAFVQVTDADGKVSYKFDAGKCSALTLEAVADSVTADKSQLEDDIAAKRDELDQHMETAVLAKLAKNQPVSPADVNRATQLKMEISRLLSKLNKRSKSKAKDAAEAPAAK